MDPLDTNTAAEDADRAARSTIRDGRHEMGNFVDDVINMPVRKDLIVTRAPEEPFRLTFIDVTCLLINRTIGTGIFNGPQEVMKGARTPGIAILMWFCGCIYCLSGAHVFFEYGLNVPRYIIDGVEQSVPRSGGELHYLQYVFSRPRYRNGTVILIGVMFGLSFICVGNMASNCIDCASRLLLLGGRSNPSEGLIRGIAIAIATATCFIHAFSRRGGILLNNVLAVVKFLFLLSIVIATWVVAGGSSGLSGLPAVPKDKSPASDEGSPNSPAQAFLFVVFAFFGFDQPSYVLGEIKHPRKNFPKAMWWGMGMVSVLYLSVNICYMLVVPADEQMKANVAEQFFARIFNSNDRATQTVNAFLAISSFGNVIVWTFTAARMKQEIAKQCFLPFSSFFAKEKDISLGRFLLWLERAAWNPNQRRVGFLNPAHHREKTPVGAFTLHLICCIILILTTYKVNAKDAYFTLSSLFSYLLAAWFGVFLALGILILHTRGPPATMPVQTPNHNSVPEQRPVQRSWRQITRDVVNPTMSIICAVLYLVGSLYPVIASWVPPSGSSKSQSVRWYVVPLTSLCILVFSTMWFFGFLGIAKYRKYYGKKEFVYVCEPEFDWAEKNGHGSNDDCIDEMDGTAVMRRGGLILTHETIHKVWKASETMVLQNGNDGNGSHAWSSPAPRQREWTDGQQLGSANNFENTDFA